MPKLITDAKYEAYLLHFLMITRQLADLSKCLLKIIRLPFRADGEKYDKLLEGYKRHAQTELADITSFVRYLCNALGLSFEETLHLGVDRKKEKEKDFRTRHPDEHWIG